MHKAEVRSLGMIPSVPRTLGISHIYPICSKDTCGYPKFIPVCSIGLAPYPTFIPSVPRTLGISHIYPICIPRTQGYPTFIPSIQGHLGYPTLMYICSLVGHLGYLYCGYVHEGQVSKCTVTSVPKTLGISHSYPICSQGLNGISHNPICSKLIPWDIRHLSHLFNCSWISHIRRQVNDVPRTL